MDENFEFASNLFLIESVPLKEEPIDDSHTEIRPQQTSAEDSQVSEQLTSDTSSADMTVDQMCAVEPVIADNMTNENNVSDRPKTTSSIISGIKRIDEMLHGKSAVIKESKKTKSHAHATLQGAKNVDKPLPEKKPRKKKSPKNPSKGVEIVTAYRCIIDKCYRMFLDDATLAIHMRNEHKESATASSIRNASQTDDTNVSYLEDNKAEKTSVYRKGIHMHVQLQEAVINMKEWYEKMNPEWKKCRVVKEISMATKLNPRSITRAIDYFTKHGTYRETKPYDERKKPSYVCSEEDRDIIEKCLHRLKDESRLNGVLDVYREITTSADFNPSFKKCGKQTFYTIFQKAGFRITDTTIVNKRPERMTSKQKNANGQWECVWPACGRVFGSSTHLVCHIRTHTLEKPYACKQPGCTYKCATHGNFVKHLKVHNISVVKNLSFERSDNSQM